MWSISCINNTLKINKKTAKELFQRSQKVCDELWSSVEEIMDDDGNITFNSDHMEHMDYLSQEEYQDILKKNKAKGRVTFGSLDGDNFGEFWGYEFDGKGNMKKVVGELVWK